MNALALLLLLGSCSFLVVGANDEDTDVSIAKAQKKFHSYQSDPLNLIRGMKAGEYDQIYIQYHRCVWSEFRNEDDDNDNDGDNDEDEEGDENDENDGGEQSGCNGDGYDENNPWYIGSSQCYRTNVAYSLYGVRNEDKTPRNACQKRYYINTFFTNNGIQDFGNFLGLENYGDATSQCTLADDGNENDEEAEDNGDKNSYEHNAQLYPNANSYTTYCTSGRLVTAMFSGAYCTGTGELELLATLTDLNEELDQVDCVLAYSAEDENENGRRVEDEGEDENEDKDIWDILSYSSVCSILEYPEGCPDPYGVKKRFGLNPRFSNRFWNYMRGIDWVTSVLFVLGTFIFLLTCCIKDRDPENKKRRGFPFRRGRSRSPQRSDKASDADTVSTNGSRRKKRGGFRGFFSRKR